MSVQWSGYDSFGLAGAPRMPRTPRAPARDPGKAALAAALLALAGAPAAWASYGQMKLDGLTFFVAVTLLYAWGILLAMGMGVGGRKYKAFAVVATVITCALAYLVVASLDDGRATMLQRPLGMGAAFVVLLLASVPVMLAAPILQRASHLRGSPGRLPMAMLVGALLFVPAGSALLHLLQDHLADRALAQTRALTPGRIQPHVVASRQRAADSWLSPYLWNEAAETKWISIGLGRLGFVESPTPLSDEDARALELLVGSSAGAGNAAYAWRLEGKLVWDRLMRAAPGGKYATVAGLTRQQAQTFNEYIGVPHADWLCTHLADTDARRAFEHLGALLSDHDRQRFSTAVRDKCGATLGATAK